MYLQLSSQTCTNVHSKVLCPEQGNNLHDVCTRSHTLFVMLVRSNG